MSSMYSFSPEMLMSSNLPLFSEPSLSHSQEKNQLKRYVGQHKGSTWPTKSYLNGNLELQLNHLGEFKQFILTATISEN